MKDLEQNIRFMLLDVTKQVENTLECLKQSTPEAVDKVRNRDNYIDNMKSVIENICFSRIHGDTRIDKRGVDRLRAAHIIANNLERLADHAVNIAIQTQYLSDPEFISRYDYKPFFNEIFTALDMVYAALFKQDMSLAFKICLSEHILDKLYKGQFERILHELRAGVETNNLITTLFTFRYLERIGDALLNIGEAVIFFILGEKFKIRQYNALRDTLSAAGREVPITDVEFQSIWGTRSGCRIGKVKSSDEGDDTESQGVIFKEGEPKKLLQEKANIEHWQEIMPDLPPKVVALREEADSVSLLIEFLGGCTVQDVILTADHEIIHNALFLVESTLREAWNQTLKKEPVNGDFIPQCEARLDDVFRLYPEFDNPVMCIGNATIPPLRGLLGEARTICAELPAPFSVFIHGDFNINNIVYDHKEQRIHYIDLHRSRHTDYVQDVSVFLVSNFRLPIFDRAGRRRIEAAMQGMLRFAGEFAEQHKDGTFQARLCLGLIRSFLTSTRFELNQGFARSMYMRGVYLLRKIVAHQGAWEDFRIPLHVLEYY
jgi:phosphate uptake regulator